VNHHRINYIEFPANDIEKTKAFYQGAFGWSFTDYGPDYVAFNDGQTDGGFTTDAKFKENGPLVILYSSNLEASLQTVVQHGGHISKPIFEFPGGRRFHFTDPNGNELAVWSDAES
jgi:predicted enzyme related to lactoylglutathione lyase